MKKGERYEVRWFDPGIATNQDEYPRIEKFGDHFPRTMGYYMGSIRISGVEICVFASTRYPDDSLNDYYLIPRGCVLDYTRLIQEP